MSEQNRIADLESRLAFQEDALDKMSDEMAQQAIEIDRLSRIVKHLSDQVKLLGPDNNPGAADADVPPPHY